MPFRHLSRDQFGLDLLKAMQAAYDAACEKLGLDGNNPMRATLASTIIDLAADGGQDNLLERAVAKLSKQAKG